ncbi:carbohydrate kinase [Nocardioides sp. YIM 152588]|uniref:carbohydrate kinase family protein n=1 Tax=Nocardioides sp. YIM 152588 TaxID=3158259 RepID=UPI0032E43A03
MVGREQPVLVVGEALVDVVNALDGTTAAHPGGSPANVALGLGRLGRAATLVTWLGDDEDGALVRRHLHENRVRVADGGGLAERTTRAIATLDATGAASYTFDLSWRLPPGSTEPGGVESRAVHVHTGSLAATVAPGGDEVLAMVRRHGADETISYDPNLRPAVMGSAGAVRARVEELVGLSDVVKVSDEDLAWLRPDATPEAVLEEWAGQGPSLVVLTRGAHGVRAVTAAGVVVELPSPSVDVVDTVGAGDSFMAALIDGLLARDLLGAAHREGLRGIGESALGSVLARCANVAAITVSRPGADPPWEHELGAADHW